MSTSTLVKSFIKNDLMDLASGKKKPHASSSTSGQYSYPLPDHAWQQQQQQPPYQGAPPNSYPPPTAQAWHQQPPPPPPQQPAYYGAHQTYAQPSHAGFAPPPPPPYVANPYGQQPPPPPPPQQQQHYQHQAPASSYAPPALPSQIQTPGTLSLRPCPTTKGLLLVTSGEGQPPAYSIQVRRSGKPKLSLFQGMPSSYGPIATADFSASGSKSTCQLTHRGVPVPCKQSSLSSSFKFEPPSHGSKLKWEPDDWSSKRLNCRKSSDSKVAKAKGGSEMEIKERMDPATVEVMILTMLMARQRQVKDNKIMKDYWEEEGESALEGGDEGGGGGDEEGAGEVIAEVLQALLGG